MAGGLGTRMRSSVPKHLHPLLGRRVVDWVIEAAGAGRRRPRSSSSPRPTPATRTRGWTVAVQEQPRGTGDAVAAARETLAGFDGRVLVLDAAAPLLTAEHLAALVAEHERAGCRGNDPVRSCRSGRCRTGGSSATPTARSAAIVEEQRRDRGAEGDPRAELLDLRVRGRAALGGAREDRRAQRPGRALPDRHDRAHRRRRRARSRLGLPRRAVDGSGSTRAPSSRSPLPSCATGSTRRTCSPA